MIGHLHLVGFLPHVALRGLDARYERGGLMLVRLGSVPMLVVSSPRAAEAVMRTHDHRLASPPPSTSARALLNGSLDVASAVYGEHWRQAKKLLTMHLLTVREVQSYRAGREEEVRLAMAKVGGAAVAGRAVDMSELLYAFTTDIMCRAVQESSSRSVPGPNYSGTTAGLIGGFNAEDYFPWLLHQVGIFTKAIYDRADKVMRRGWDELLDMVIDDHESKLVQEQEPDFLEVLLSHQHEYGLTRDHLKAMLIVRKSLWTSMFSTCMHIQTHVYSSIMVTTYNLQDIYTNKQAHKLIKNWNNWIVPLKDCRVWYIAS